MAKYPLEYRALDEDELYEVFVAAFPEKYEQDYDDDMWDDVMDHVLKIAPNTQALMDLLGRLLMLTPPLKSRTSGVPYHAFGPWSPIAPCSTEILLRAAVTRDAQPRMQIVNQTLNR